MKRKLASVQYVHDVTPIEGADLIETAHVLGWQCVVKKGEFKVGDKGIYFEIDSFLPIKPEFEFLRSSSYKETDLMGEGFRLRTKRMRGQLSQGLLLPLSILPDPPEGKDHWEIGDDVTEVLGVKKYEIEERASVSGTIIGQMPFNIPKTDELRIQSFPELIDALRGKPYYITTKMDGSSVTMFYINGRFGVATRNYELKDDDKSIVWKYAHEHDVPEKLAEYAEKHKGGKLVLQGEFCGPGIQKNRLKLKRPEWYIFNVLEWDERRLEWFVCGLDEISDIAKVLGLNMVPIEEFDNDFSYSGVEELLDRAEGKYESGKQKEGIVIRPTDPEPSSITGGWLSMKAINNKYLLKGGE